MPTVNRQIHLVSRPAGACTLQHFKLVETPLPELGPHQVLVRNHYLSLDPYMRGRMDDRKSYAAPQPLNTVMIGATVGEVVASTIDPFSPGDKVATMGGWQEYLLVDASQLKRANAAGGVSLRKVDATQIPLSAYLGALGMPGVTAWMGLTQICVPLQGETLVVSSAAGAVGGAVGQLAKERGCRAVGIAGGPEKCRYVKEELGFDECIDYKRHADLRALVSALAKAAPAGIDCCFENVGGVVFDAALSAMNDFGRVALCGLIAGYNGEPNPITYPSLILGKRLKMQGFIVSDRLDLWPAALEELRTLMLAGKLRYRETVTQGLEHAPQAFLDLLKGRSIGKAVVKLI
jgi:NADPH-dependent curcumin reductase CurA